jgi:hypothetical protein
MWLPLWAGQTGGDRVLTRLAESRYSAAPNGMLDLGSQTCAEGGECRPRQRAGDFGAPGEPAWQIQRNYRR